MKLSKIFCKFLLINVKLILVFGFSISSIKSNSKFNNNIDKLIRPDVIIDKDILFDETLFISKSSIYYSNEIDHIINDTMDLYFYDNIYNYGERFLHSYDKLDWRYKKVHSKIYYNSDLFIMNYYRNKIINIIDKNFISYRFFDFRETKFLKLIFYNHLEKFCSEAYIGKNCLVPSICTNVQKLDITDTVSLCYGHSILDNWKFYNISVSYLFRGNSNTEISYNNIFDMVLFLKNGFQVFFPFSLLNFKNYFDVDLDFNNVFLKLKFLDLEYIGGQFSKTSSIGFIPVNYHYKYICDDNLYKNLRMVDNIYIYPSSRGYCKKYMYYNKTHYFCFDLLFSSHEICPKDYFILSEQLTNEIDINKVFILPIKNNTDIYIGYINYYIDSFFIKFMEIYDIVKTQIFKYCSELYDQMYTRLEKIFDFKLIIDYLIQKQKDNIDYFIQKLSSRNTTVNYNTGLYGNWISDIFGVLIKPFTEAFLAILKEFWEFLRDPILEILNIFLDIIIDLILDFEKLLNKVLIAIEPKLLTLVKLLIKLLVIIQNLIVTLYAQIDNEFMLTEYIIIYILILYCIKNTLASSLILLLIILVFGVNRRFCSLLLTILHEEYKINKTGLYVCNLSSLIDIESTIINKNNSWFNIKELDFLFDVIENN